jgi:AraC-like DNA-binding protein
MHESNFLNNDLMNSSTEIKSNASSFHSSISFEELVAQYFENDAITIPSLAKKMGISVSTLERLVKSKYGITPKQFIIEYKLRRAEILLREGNKNIKQIAAEIGFNSVAYFCHCFKKKFTKPPKVYAAFLLNK